MTTYEINCEDGTDRNCRKTVDVTCDLKGLSPDQIQQVVTDQMTWLTQSQVDENSAVLRLTEAEKKDLATHGTVEVDGIYHSGQTICGACGSDQTYDSEGNNITAL